MPTIAKPKDRQDNCPGGRGGTPTAKASKRVARSPPTLVPNPWQAATALLEVGRSGGSPSAITEQVRSLVTMLDGGGHVAIRWSTEGRIEVRCGRALVTVAPRSVSVNAGRRRGFAVGDAAPLVEALAPSVAGGRYRIAHEALAALPDGSTGLTVALAVHVEALLDVAGDGSTIPDGALAEAAGCTTRAVKQHRDRLRAVFEICGDRGKTPGRPMYRYRRREWDESRGVAYLPAWVLTDPEFTTTDVAVLVGRAGWSDYQGRINPGGSLRAVARRGRINVASVSRTYAKLRERGLLVGDRLRVEQLLPSSPHARAHCRQDLQAATNRARRRCSRPPHRSQRGTYATHDSVSPRRPKDSSSNPPLPGAQQRAQQKQRRKKGGQRPRSLRPVRVFVPEFEELEVLASAPGWAGPTLQEIATDARRFGWAAATAATLEVEWRLHQTKLAPRNPKALNRTIAPCYAGRCPAPERHSGECGPVAARLHTARRADDLDYRRRVIDAKRRQPSAGPRLLPAMPGPDRAAPDPRIVMLRRMIGGIEDGTMRRDTVLDLVEATGIEGILRSARNGPE